MIEEIINFIDTDEPLPIEAWGQTFFTKYISLKDWLKLHTKKEDDDEMFILRNIVYGTADKDGNPIFTEADIPALKKKNPNILKQIFNKVTAYNSVEKKS